MNSDSKQEVTEASGHPSSINAKPVMHTAPWHANLRVRYLIVSIMFTGYLVISGWYAETLVSDATRTSIANTSDRQTLRADLQSLTDEIWSAETALQAFLLVPSQESKANVLKALEMAESRISAIEADPWIKHELTFTPDTKSLKSNIARLRDASAALMATRTNPEQLFPAMSLMLTHLLPANTNFYSLATLAMDEAEELSHLPGQTEVFILFSKIRHNWTLMVGAFRNWVANRFGIFGEAESSMRAQAHNINLYSDVVEKDLVKLSGLEKQGVLQFQQQDSLAEMRKLKKMWLDKYGEADAIMTSERWRADTPVMRDHIQPLFRKIWKDIHETNNAINAYSADDMAFLSRVARQLSSSMWLLALIGIAIVAAGYFLFDYTVRRPIARVASALKAEAKGESGIALPHSGMKETLDLIEAFGDMREKVHNRQQRLETILDNAAEGILTFDEHGVIESCNHAAERLFGYGEEELVGKSLVTVIPPPDMRARREGYIEHFMRTEIQRLIGHEGEVTGKHKDGSQFPLALKVSRILLEGRPVYTGLVADISERKALLDHLKNMAEHDGLTGLYNRSFLLDELERVVARANRDQELKFALLYIDLDNFKYINDTMGHAAGDKLLIEVSSILNKRARKSDLITRLGGDEFAVLLYNNDPDQSGSVAESFRDALSNYNFNHEKERVDISCSIGVSQIGVATRTAEEVLSRADLACHLAKRAGRNRVHVFKQSDEASVASMSVDMGWSRRIKHAIENNRFALACQPIVGTSSRNVDAYEVLIRMYGENGELIPPGGFLPSAERFGLAVDIDKWVITNAIETLVLQRQTLPELRYSINLSGQTLSDPGVCDLIVERLESTKLDPGALTFEVTETAAIADMTRAESFLARLQTIGCRTALDDFGSGFSSFAYLKDLPVDEVKIDGRFVRNLSDSPVDQAVVKAMNDIAHVLGKQTTAEFVENEESFLLLKEFGVDFAQGYHLGRPSVTLPCQAIAEHADIKIVCKT